MPKHYYNEKIVYLIKMIRNKTKFGADRIKFYLSYKYNHNIPCSAIIKREGLIIKRNKRRKPILY